MNHRSRASLVLIALLTLAGCGGPTVQSGLPTATMKIGSKAYTLEIAGDAASREHGLMERDSLEPDHGMIFVFDVPAEQAFWMHHTNFPLDIIFADSDGRIISISTMKAFDENLTRSNGPAKYAIEIGAGEANAAGVKPGDPLQYPQAVLKK